MKKKISTCIILFFLAVICMIGCSKLSDGKDRTASNEQSGSPDDIQIRTEDYTVSQIGLETKDGSKIEHVLITKEAIFYICSGIQENMNFWNMYRLSLMGAGSKGSDSLSLQNAERIPLPQNTGSISNLFLDRNGNVFITGSSVFLKGETGGYFLAEYASDGSLLEQYDIAKSITDIEGIRQDEKILISSASKGKDDVIYFGSFADENVLWSIDGEGDLINTLFLEEDVWDLAAAEDGNLYAAVTKNDGSYICHVDMETGKLLTISSLPKEQAQGRLFVQTDGQLLYSGQTILYKVNSITKSLEALYAWTDSGYVGKNIKSVCYDSDGGITAAAIDSNQPGKYTLLQLEPGSSESDKKTIILGCIYESQELLEQVGRFNTKQELYSIEIRTYPIQEGSKRLEAEIMSGAGPDLIDMNLLYVKEYVNKNLLEDLNLYLEKSQAVKREDLVESVLSVNTVDGVLTCIPSAFMIDILAGKASEIGERDRWTMEEFKEYVSSHEGAEIFEGVTYGGSKELIVLMDIWSKEDKYIDWENRRAGFDSEEFIDLLRFAEQYTSKIAVDHTPTSLKLQDGRVLLYNMGIRSMEDYIYQKGLLQGDIVHIGYPGQAEEYNYGIMTNGAYGIMSNSKNKEGAWSFIEFLIQDTSEGKLLYGFPIRNSALEQHFKESSIENSYLDGNGRQIIRPKVERIDGETKVEIYAASQEDIQKVRTMIQNISYVKYNDTPVTGIVLEEITSLFFGMKDPDETARIIQNRVQLYVNETAKVK